MCGHLCKCFCHKNGDMACARCICVECEICDSHVVPESYNRHITLCHNMAQAHVSRLGNRPPLADLVAVAA